MPRLVGRRALAALNRAAAAEVTLISAPGRSGKTSLVRRLAACLGPARPARDAAGAARSRDSHAVLASRCYDQAGLLCLGHGGRAERSRVRPDFNVRAMVDRCARRAAGLASAFPGHDDLTSCGRRTRSPTSPTLPRPASPPVTRDAVWRRGVTLRSVCSNHLRPGGRAEPSWLGVLALQPARYTRVLSASGVELSEAGAALLHERTEVGRRAAATAIHSLARSP